MSFVTYDLIFLVLFLAAVSIFLYTRRKNLKKEGLLYLYKTKWGIKLINSISQNNKKTLKILSYVSIASGYILMICMFYLVYTLVKIYVFNPEVVRAIKIPPIMPLVPYLPQVFKLEFLPPFYFTYWIVIIAIIAITHEMAHGIFAAHDKIKIKTTGFGFFPYFFPVFLAAFVEPDEKAMQKRKKISQLAILSGGTFANVLTTIFFFIILIIFSSFAFSPGGVIFDKYADSSISIADISAINNITLNNASYYQILNFANDEGFNELKVGKVNYLATKEMLKTQEGNENIAAYYSAPAIKENLSSIIISINGVEINSVEELVKEISKYSPGDEVNIRTLSKNNITETTLTFEERPDQEGVAWLGIAFISQQKTGFVAKIVDNFSFRELHVYYKPKFGEISIFIYNLIWWIVIISLSVALINMLPVGIFDGGKFFYLTVWGITKNEKIAKGAFKFLTWFFLLILLVIMILWAVSFLR